MKKKALTAAVAGLLSAGMLIPGFASGASGGEVGPAENGTDIYAGIILKDQDAKVRVTVPTIFAFVVNGSVSTSETGAVTSENGGIFLPNITVRLNEGTDNSSGDFIQYTIETVADTTLGFTNYSTYLDEEQRHGLEVMVSGSVWNEGGEAARNYWSHVADAEALEGDTDGYKQYTLSVDGKKFNQVKNNTYAMEAALVLAAPELGFDGEGGYSNMDDRTMLALTGTQKDAVFDVAVGGRRNQYQQVEESVKIGTISWTVSAALGGQGIYTAPDNDYLDGIPDPANDKDPDNIELK